MRVIAGTLGGRRLAAPTRGGLRATQDRVRETLFNMVGEGVQGTRVADLFAGTGALGIEALSRGAREAVFVENGRAALRLLGENLRGLGLEERSSVWHGSVGGFLARGADAFEPPFDLILADPPYDTPDADATVEAVASGAALAPGGLLVVERRASDRRAEPPEGLELLERRACGDTRLDFYRRGGS